MHVSYISRDLRFDFYVRSSYVACAVPRPRAQEDLGGHAFPDPVFRRAKVVSMYRPTLQDLGS
jgi:hypothetical protein